jgi:hypothetical protein
MTDGPDLPPDLRELDRRLRGVRFEPRASLEAEILHRARRGELPDVARPTVRRRRRALLGLAAGVLLAVGIGIVGRAPGLVRVDRCCFDLDGGGPADDGVVLLAERDAAVRRMRIYEDLDRSRSFSPGDVIRLDRGGRPALLDQPATALVTTRHCCVDLDGGGPDDDALLVIGVPPDRVVMAAIYEQPAPGGGVEPARALQLR